MVVIRNLIGKVSDLRFQGRLLTLNEALTDIAQLARIVERAMFENAFACFEAQIQSVKRGLTLFQLIHNAQRL